ncbi:MAG: LysM peptidoglycan-binding domain-containing protein [Oscillospiraceae bacterium]|nr:LysM peptidoglycan-binding domain-containing protein [Oscillospiraceae bacterium]
MADSDMIITLATGKTRVNNSIMPKTYVVQQGDSLYKIARRFYGDGSLWGQLYEKNVASLTHPLLLPVGTVLYL